MTNIERLLNEKTNKADRYAGVLRGIGNRISYRLTSADSDVMLVAGARRKLGITAKQIAWMQRPEHGGGGLPSVGALYDALETLWANPDKESVKVLTGLSVSQIKKMVDRVDR